MIAIAQDSQILKILIAIREKRLHDALSAVQSFMDKTPTQEGFFLLGILMSWAGRADAEVFFQKSGGFKDYVDHFIYLDRYKSKKYMDISGVKKQGYIYYEAYKKAWKYSQIQACVVSYPKCGRTWLRSIFLYYLTKLSPPPANSYKSFDEILELSSKEADFLTTMFTHDSFPQFLTSDQIELSAIPYQGKKVIFMYRDPRDVLVSSYMQLHKRRKVDQYLSQALPEDINAFALGDVAGIDGIIKFFNLWADQAQKNKDIMMISYEEMRQDSFVVCKKILNTLVINVDEKLLSDSIEKSSFAAMKKMEEQGQTIMAGEKMGAVNANDPESFKVRKGKIGGYVDYFSPEIIEKINAKMRAGLNPVFLKYLD